MGNYNSTNCMFLLSIRWNIYRSITNKRN